MTLTVKDFINSYCMHTAMDKSIVTDVATAMERWMHTMPLKGNDIRLSFGKLEIRENNYVTDTLNRTEGARHHTFRPHFSFPQKYKKEVANNEESIRNGMQEG